MGQTRKCSPRAHIFRCSPNNGLKSDVAACPAKGAVSEALAQMLAVTAMLVIAGFIFYSR